MSFRIALLWLIFLPAFAAAQSSDVRVNGERLNDTMQHMHTFGENDEGGSDRVAYSNHNHVALSYLANLMIDEDQAWAEGSAQIFDDCRRAVSRGILRQRLKELDTLEEDARQRGDEAALNACLRERMDVNLKIKKSP